MAKFVIDANVAIKWVLPEIYTEIALRLNDIFSCAICWIEDLP